MAAALPWIAAAGVGLQLYGTAKSASDTASAAKKQAALEAAVAKRKEEVYREDLRKLLSTQRTLYAKAGVDLSSGSPVVVAAMTAAEGEEEAQYIRKTGQTTADMTLSAGKSAAASTWLSGLGNALGGTMDTINFFTKKS